MKQSDISDKYLKLLNSYKDPEICRKLFQKIHSYDKPINLMEVCGTHTVALFRTGVRAGLPKSLNLVSGPGCPVCVTPVETIERAVGLACKENTVLFCFGDMLKVPGIKDSLESAQAGRDAHVKIIYSPLDALEYAKKEPQKKVILFGVGFETTIPLFASVLIWAKEQNVKNLYLLPAFKLVPPALDVLLTDETAAIDGFILPGHVSSIIGKRAYQFMSEKYNMPGVITGFEPVDMLEGILLLVEMISKGSIHIKNQYTRYVTEEGNRKAQDVIAAVFEPCDVKWRGLGTIPDSGLKLRQEYAGFDADLLIDFDIGDTKEPAGCRCGDVILGKCAPPECKLYKSICTLANPVGPCMVSSEGTCAAYYKYAGQR